MGLFTSLIFNNGTAHTFTELGTFPMEGGVIRKYIEPAAANELNSLITIKQDFNSKTLRRALCQRTCLIIGADGKYYPYTANFSTTFNRMCTEAAVTLEQKMLTAALADASFHANFIKGLS